MFPWLGPSTSASLKSESQKCMAQQLAIEFLLERVPTRKKREAYQPCLVLSKKFYTLSHQIGSSYLGVLNKILLQNLLRI